MASSHFYEGYRSNVSANRSGERSNFTGANVAAKKLSKPSSASALDIGACAFLTSLGCWHCEVECKQSGYLQPAATHFAECDERFRGRRMAAHYS
jgi:hypothetical protein